MDRGHQAGWLFLEESAEYKGCWEVDSLWPDFFFDFAEVIGQYKLVTPLGIDTFLGHAQEKGYNVAFLKDPMTILDRFTHLSDPPPFSLNSTLEHTVQGMLPWQVTGFNKLIKDELPMGYVVWDTGTGKTAFIASAIRWHAEYGHPFDLALVVVKAHNKIDTQKKLMSLADIPSVVVDGTPKHRDMAYGEVIEGLAQGIPQTMVINYEKFRDETSFFKYLVQDKRCLFFWDEMPTKLSNHETQLYRRVTSSLYSKFPFDPRPSWMRHWILSATPVENDPAGVFSCVDLAQPGILGTRNQFYAEHVVTYNPLSGKPQAWYDLDRIGARLIYVVDRVSKKNPEVAKMFPEVVRTPITIDWSAKHRAVYNRLTKKASEIVDEEDFSDANILAMIQVMQMICDAPSMVQASGRKREDFLALLRALNEQGMEIPADLLPEGSEVALRLLSVLDVDTLTDTGHPKLETWLDIIQNKHPEEKVITHSTWAGYIFPVWTALLDKHEISYVVYTGTSKQKQTALDAFRDDPSIRCFLSGDAGADSIDIAEASVGINYNGSWKATVHHQREGRRDRVNSTFKTIWTYDLMMSNSTDEYKRRIRGIKQGYHDAIFENEATETALVSGLTKADMIFMLTGEEMLG